jgi:hypothetical protein
MSGGIEPIRNKLERLPGFSDLSEREQKQFLEEHNATSHDLEHIGKIRATVGRRLHTIRAICKKKKLWRAWLDMCGIPWTSANRWIQAYIQVQISLPPNYANVALDIGVDTISPDLVRAYPPPNTTDRAKMVGWVQEIKKVQRQERRGQVLAPQRDILAQIVSNYYRSQRKRLGEDATAKERRNFALECAGMILNIENFQSSVQVSPVIAPPEPKRGRPHGTKRQRP